MAIKRKINIFLNILMVISVLLCTLAIVIKTAFMQIVVNGNSMNPTIDNGAKGYMLKVNKLTKIDRFDVVACDLDKTGFYIIKRVVGLPNEKIELVDNELIVNGNVVKQDFTFIPSTKNFKTTSFALAENQYLLVGDNRIETIEPVIAFHSDLVAKNGFAYATYDVTSEKCKAWTDYSSCPIDNRKWYKFKYGK